MNVGDLSFPLVSRERLKVIDRSATETGDGTDSRPTEIEKAWFDIVNATDAAREGVRKKIAVCGIADVVEYDPQKVTIRYEGENYTILSPTNGLAIAKAREISATLAFEILVTQQRRVLKGAVPVSKDFLGMSVEVIRLLTEVADSFFFVPYL